MTSYATLLGSYRMSGSSQVLPPARQQESSYLTTTSSRGGASADSYQQERASYFARASSASTSAIVRPRSSAPSVSKYPSSSSSSNNNAVSAASRQPLVQAADLDMQQRYYQQPSTQPQTYISTSSNNNSSIYYSYNNSTTPVKNAAASSLSSSLAVTPSKQLSYASASSSPSANNNNNNGSSAANTNQVLTQVQRNAAPAAKSQIMNHASHHRLRSSMYRPKWDPALPRTRYSHRPLLILDLDETLVHATTTRPHGASSHTTTPCDLQFNVDMGSNQAPVPVWVALRPGAKQFVYDIAAYFEVAVFTASIKNYADKVCECLDPSGTLIQHRLYRDHCSDVDGVFVKDLALLNRPLHRVAILDNSPHAYLFHPENSIPILSWFDCPRDNELQKLTPMLIQRLAQSEEVYGILEQYRANL